MMEPRLLVISPVRNEAAHIERVVRAVAAQVLAPARWIVIDDSSTDRTLELLRALQPGIPFLEVVERRPEPELRDARDRLALAAAPRAFNAALEGVDLRDYSHVMKLDGDIELRPTYLRDLLAAFASDPHLGLAGGVLDEPTADGGLRRIAIPPSHVHGALKCYSRGCFEAIGGLEERLGWDTIDETRARMANYGTRTFTDLVSLHHRPIGSADGTLRGRARHGTCAYIAHYGLLWVSLRAFKVALSRPFGLSGAAFFFGYVRAALAGVEQVPDPEFRRFTRRELRRRMRDGILGAGRRLAPSGSR